MYKNSKYSWKIVGTGAFVWEHTISGNTEKVLKKYWKINSITIENGKAPIQPNCQLQLQLKLSNMDKHYM